MTDLHVDFGPKRTDVRCGRHVVHDPASRAFARNATVDTSTWRTRTLRIYDPTPNPDQTIGNCTAVSKCVMFNTADNRRTGVVLRMLNADMLYFRETQIDPFPGTYPPDDTGSNGLAACKAAVEQGLGGEYRWLFGGVDEVVQTIMDGKPVSVGTWWFDGMFNLSAKGFIAPTGPKAGGHQYTIHGYNEPGDYLIGRCWWGTFRDFKIKRVYLGDLLADDGDAHVQERA